MTGRSVSNLLTLFVGSVVAGIMSVASSAYGDAQSPNGGATVSPMSGPQTRRPTNGDKTDAERPAHRQAIEPPRIPGGAERLKHIQRRAIRDRQKAGAGDGQAVRDSHN